MSAERAQTDVRVPAPRCPYCHEDIPRGVEPVACPQCHALHHRECLIESAICSACSTPYAGKSIPVARPKGPIVPGVLATRFRQVTLGAHGVVALVALGATFGDGGDATIAWSFWAASIVALAVSRFVAGSARIWAAYPFALSAGLLAWVTLVRHAHERHLPETRTAIGILLGVGGVIAALVAWLEKRDRGAGRAPPREKSGPGKEAL